MEHGLTYKVSELQISKDNRHGSNEVLCFVGLDEDQGHGTQCSDSWTRYLRGLVNITIFGFASISCNEVVGWSVTDTCQIFSL